MVACNLSEIDLVGLAPSARAGHISCSPYFNGLDSDDNRSFKARMAMRHGHDRRLTNSFVGAYASVSILAQAMRDAASDAPEAIRRIVTSRHFETPMGSIAIDRRTHHAALRPHIGQSNTEGEFDIFESAPGAIEADPYLVHTLARFLASRTRDAATSTANTLKVIK